MEYYIKAIVSFEPSQIEWLNIIFNFFGTIVGVCIGAWFSMKITEKHFKDNNKFIVFTDSKNQVRSIFDNIQNIVNQEINLLNEIEKYIEAFMVAYPSTEIKNEYERYLERMVVLNNTQIEYNNHLTSQYRLLSKYFGKENLIIEDLNNQVISVVTKISEIYTSVNKDLKTEYDSFLNHCDYTRFAVDSKLIMEYFENSNEVKLLFKINVSDIDDYLNEIIIKLLK